jgi:chemotaxis family two-component system response regulator Rcp1
MSQSPAGQPVEVLLVEDNPGDVRLTSETLKAAKIHVNMNIVPDGYEAMAYLRREGQYSSARRPDLIFLDLDLPKMNGYEVLGELKKDPHLKQIPVVILRSSPNEEDILRSLDLHADCYITKPIGLNQIAVVVRSIKDFWLAIVRLSSEQA